MALSLPQHEDNFFQTVLKYLRVAGVADTIGATDEGLEGNVGNQLTEGALKTTNSAPGLMGEGQANVKHLRDAPKDPRTRSA